MPSYTFTSPEGKSYTVNGPEGSTQEQAWGILQQQLAVSKPSEQGLPTVAPPIAPPRPAGPVVPTDVMGNVIGEGVEPAGIASLAPAVPAAPAITAPPKPPSEFAPGEELVKGAAGAFNVALPSMWEQAGVMKDVGVLGTVQKRLELFGKIDKGEVKDFDELRGLDLTTSQARSYLGATPEQRDMMKARLAKEVGQRTDFVKAAITTLAQYQEEMKKYKGRTTDLTDVEGATDFANWLAYNVGSGAVQLAPIMIAAVTTGGPGVLALGTTMGVSEAVGNRMQFLEEKIKDLPDDKKAEAVIDYVTKTGDTSLAVGIISGALDNLLGPAATLAKRGLSQVVKGETRAKALKEGIKEIPRQAGEEFITGGAQEAAQIAGAVREKEQSEFLTVENLKKILNSAAAEAAGAVGGGGMSTAARVYGAKPEEKGITELLKETAAAPVTPAPPSNSPIVGTTQVDVGGNISTKVTRRDGSVDIDGVQVVPPTSAAPAEAPSTDLVKQTIPESESQDYEAMLAELEQQIEGKPADKTAKPESQLFERIGLPEGPARENAKNEEIPLDDKFLLKDMVVKTVEDGLTAGRTREQITQQLEALTKGGIKNTDMQRINEYLTEKGVKENPKVSQVTPESPVPTGFRYTLLESPYYEGLEPLSLEDADFELEALEENAERGRLTPEQFAQSEIGKRLGTGQIMQINKGLRTDPVGTIKALRDNLAPAQVAETPAAPEAVGRATELTKEQYRADQETFGKSAHGAMGIDLGSVKTDKQLISKYGENDVRTLGKLYGITVKDIKSVAKKLLDINNNLSAVESMTAQDYAGTNVAGLKDLLKQMGQSTFGNRQALVDRLVAYQPSVTKAFNERLQDAKHKTAVTKAVQNNQQVSDDVLKDYPDLMMYARDRNSDPYKLATRRMALKITQDSRGTEIPAVAQSMREDIKNVTDPKQLEIMSDIADAIDEYYETTFGERSANARAPVVEEKREPIPRQKNTLTDFFSTGEEGELELYNQLSTQPQHKDILAAASNALQQITHQANDLGFEIYRINNSSPKEAKALRNVVTDVTVNATMYAATAKKIEKNPTPENKQRLEKIKADLEQAIKDAGVNIKPTPKKPKTALEKASPLRIAAYKKNPFLTFLADKGLYHEKGKPGSQMNEFNAGQQYLVSGYGPIFKRSGMLPDDLVVYAIQDGYLPQDATESDVVNLIELAISGKKVEPIYSEQGQEDMAAKYAERAAEEEDSYEERTDQTDAEWYGMSEEKYTELMADQLADVSDEDFSALDGAINELMETPSSTMTARAAMEALGFTEEEIQNEERKATTKAGEAAAKEEAPSTTQGEAAPATKQAAITEPPVPNGYVRLYHSGEAGEGKTGRWVSTNRDYASNYRPDLPLFYFDVKADDPRVNNPDYPDQGAKQGFTFNFELSNKEAAKLTEIARKAPEELELKTQTADELKAKQDEIDRLNKENERLAKQAEAKAKADAERGEFVLTGSDRIADEAAARGQQDIFGAIEEEPAKPKMTEKEILARMKELTREEMKDPEENPARDKEQADLARQLKALKAAEAPKEEPVKEAPTEEAVAEPELSQEYQVALTESRDAAKEFAKAQQAYRAQTIGDTEFLAARKAFDVVMNKYDEAYTKERDRMVAEEVVGPEETPPFPRLTREPYTFEGEFTEKGEEEQVKLLEAPIEKLSKDQINTLEKHYGLESGTAEFVAAVRKDVLDFVVKGATAVNGKIRAIIRALVNGVLATSLIFNPQFVSNAYTVSVPQYDVSQRQVLEQIPNKVAGQMSEAAKRAYAVIYPALKTQLKANNKFFIVADKQTATTFIFNPDGTPFMYDKTLFGAGIGDFMKGDNNVVANRITPAGLFDLGMRDAQRSADEAYMYGDYDFGKVFVLDKAYMGRNGPYSQLVMHSVWLNEKDAKQRLAALEKPGADDSRYSFGCINVKKDLFRDLITNHMSQMDGAKIFIVPENGSNVMDFVNGKATYSPDIIRQRVAPVTEEVKTEKQRAEQRAGAKIYAREEEGQNYYSIQQIKQNPYVTQDEIRGMQYKAYDELRQTEAFKKSQQRIKDAQEESSKRFDAVVEESVRLLKENPQFKNVLGDLSESSIYNIAMAYRDQAEKNVPAVKLSEHDALVAQNKLIEDFYKSKNIPEPRPFSNQANQDRDYYSDPKFKKWFKASKAVDKNGKPFVGFHTTDKSFGVFNVGEKIEGKAVNPNYTGKLGSWFTAPSLYDREYEEGNAENAVSFSEGKEGDNTMLVHLSIQNPIEYEGFEDLQDDRDSYPSVEEFKQALIDKGHDGVVVRNSMTDGNVDRDDWVAFYPTQIKSAIGNRGTFDTGSGNILESVQRKLPPGRSPELSAAAQLVKDGQMTAAEYDELVNLYKPIRPYAEPLKPATKEQVYDALDSAKREKINPEIPDGTRVGLRLDIPAFNRKGVYVVSIHQKGTKSGPGKVMGYDSVARVTDATFGLGRATAALDIAAGAGKDALQTIEGSYEKISPADAYAKAQEALNDPAWTQIGIDPTRHAYFYDRSTTQPVVAAEEILQIGNMVLGKNVTYGDKQQFLYDVAPNEPDLGQKPTDWDYIPDAQELKKRNPSLKRRLDKLNRDRDAGKISDEKFIQEVDAALKYAEMINEEARVPPRVRGYRRIKEVLNRDVRKGVLEADAADLAEWFIDKNPALVDDLGVSVKSPSEAGVGGFYNNLSRIMVLIKGGGARGTIVHEILHHLERMMPTEMQRAIREAWGKQLLAAQKRAKKPAEKLYFAALIEAHYGNNDHDFIDVADGEMSVAYVKALSEMHFVNPGNKSALELAKTLLQNGSVDLDRYQFFNPSEFWAVNGTRIVEGRYDAVKGGVLARLKNWLGELYQKLKGVLGFNSDLSVLLALNSLSKSDGTFVSTKMLADGFAYQNIKTNYKGGELPSATWAMRDSSLWDDFVHTWQDNYRDLRTVQEIITKKFGKINTLFNAYDKEILSSGRETERVDDFVRLELRPLIKDMLDSKVTNNELATYMHNRYAPERNEIINEKNQSPSVRDQGSGISTTDAAEYMKKLNKDRKAVLEKLAQKVDDIVRKTQDVLVEDGQETQETIDGWRRTSPHYVPLNRDESELDFVIGRSGIANIKGLGTRGAFGKQALGSTKTVVNILENIMLQRGRAVHRGEAARVGKALYGLSIVSSNTDFWMPINPDAIKNKDKLLEEMIEMGYDPDFAEDFAKNLVAQPRTARLKNITVPADLLGPEREVRTVTYQVDRNYQMAKNVFPVRINGQDRYILFNPKSAEAQRLVGILKDMNAEQLSSFVGAASTLTRWFSSVNSQYNPAFGLVNLWNDVQSGLLNLTATPLAGKQKEVLKNILPALAGLGAAIRRNRSSDTRQAGRPVTILGAEVARADWGDLWERSRLAGGKTGYRGAMVKSKLRLDLFNPDFKKKITAEDEHLMESELRALERGTIMKKAIWFADLVSDFNDTLENAVRLAAFEVAVRPVKEGGQGMTDEEAAVVAKTLTINFNKHGARTKNIRGLYAFFNAGVQSTARLALTLAGPAGKKIVKYGLMLGAFNALLMMAFGFDDDEPPEYVKNKGFVVPLGGGSYFLWNLPGGFRALPNSGRILMEGALISLGALHSNKGLGGKAMDAAMVLTDAVNPLGNGGGLQVLAPTFLDPYVAITQNKDAFGRPISKEDQALNPTAGWLRTRDNASEISKGLSYFLNYITSGGEPYAKGFVSPTGDQLDFLFAQVVGGAGKEAQRLGTTISNKIKGEETPAYQRPMVNRVYGELGTPAAISARFYDNITMLAEHKNIIEGRAKDGQDFFGYIKSHPQAQYAFAAEEMENEVSNINSTIHKIRQQPETAQTKKTIKELEEGRTKMMFEFNAIVRSPAKVAQ